jgi:hypothetical protein
MTARGYDTPSQVLDEALRMLTGGAPRERELTELRAKVKRSLDQIDRGEVSNRTIPEILEACNREWNAGGE